MRYACRYGEKRYVDMDDEIPHTHLRYFVHSLMNSLEATIYLLHVLTIAE
jgi:hypothetical protein